jgi:putative hemolysin
MDGINTIYLILVILCIGFSAFFSSSEIAFISLQKIRLKHLESTGEEGAGRVAKIMEKPERFLSTVVLGNNFVNTGAAALGTAILLSVWEGSKDVAVLIATIIITAALLIFGEIIPKIVAAQHSERIALLYATPIKTMSLILSPIVALLGWVGTGVSKLVRGTPADRTLVTEDEIRTMISVGRDEGVVEEVEAKMLHRVFEFGDDPVREAMTPRPDVVWIEKGTKLADFLKTYAQFPHSRFPVYEESSDNVIGLVSIKDILMAQADGQMDNETSLDSLIRSTIFVPESKRIAELFTEMQATGNQMAVVVDEYGGIDGIVTMEQLLEQVVGHFGDELAKRVKEFQAIDEFTYEVDGSMRIDELNEELGLGLPEGDYETIAGFILNQIGHIPEMGEQLRYSDMKIVVKEVRGLKIEKLRIIKEIKQEPTDI